MTVNESSIRVQRVADLIRREVANTLCKEITDPRLQALSITAVDVSPDLRNAKVYFTLLDDSKIDDVNKALEKAAGFLRRAVASQCELRYVPKLIFKYDNKLSQAESLVSLISDANQEAIPDSEKNVESSE